MTSLSPAVVEIRHFHLFCGLGGAAKGFNRGSARVGNVAARFRCIGGVDVDAAAIRDFSRAAGVPGTVLDLFSRDQFVAFHGREPAAGWKEVGAADLHAAAGGERPHIVFLSAPCKGFSGLLSETASRTAKYQALNGLTLRGVWLMLEAWRRDPPELVVFENVPRIAKRGRHLLDQIVALLRSYGYAVAETQHDCGVLGGLGQSRKRFLLVARHAEKVPPFLYEPGKQRLRGVGEVIGRLPIPGSGLALPMHRMPALQWKTWVRLAFVEAGADWRSLNRLRVEDGMLADFGIMPDGYLNHGVLGVRRWEQPAATVTSRSAPGTGAHAVADPRPGEARSGHLGVRDWTDISVTVTTESRPTNSAFSVADPRPPASAADFHGYRLSDWSDPAGAITTQRSPGSSAQSVADPRVDGHERSVQLGVRRWDRPAGVVTGKMFAGGGPNAVADPRLAGAPRFNSAFRIVAFGAFSPAVAGPGGPGGGLAVADPRPGERDDYKQTKYRITDYAEPAGTVIAASTTGNGAFAIADPRPAGLNANREAYVSGGHYGVVPWEEPSGAVPGFSKNNNGPWSVADPRSLVSPDADELPAASDRLVCCIQALDGTWHRPFTTLELAALQGLVDAEEALELDGLSDSAWRERIGNAVPPPAAEAIAGVMGRTLLLAWAGETFLLSAEPIWVRDVAVALSVHPLPQTLGDLT